MRRVVRIVQIEALARVDRPRERDALTARVMLEHVRGRGDACAEQSVGDEQHADRDDRQNCWRGTLSWVQPPLAVK